MNRRFPRGCVALVSLCASGALWSSARLSVVRFAERYRLVVPALKKDSGPAVSASGSGEECTAPP